jgi:hypothetical protein
MASEELKELDEYVFRCKMLQYMLDNGYSKEIIDNEVAKLQELFNQRDKHFDLKCQFCDAEVKGVTEVPKGWLSGRMFRRKEPAIDSVLGIIEKEFIRSPVACPEHKRQLHLLTMEVEDV